MEMKIHINHLKTLLPCLLSSVARSQGRRPRGVHSVCKVDRSGVENRDSCLVLGGFGKSSQPPYLWHPFPEDAVLPMRLLWAQRSQHRQSSQDWSCHEGRCLGKLPVVTWASSWGHLDAVHSQAFYSSVSVPSVTLQRPSPLCYLSLCV